MSKAYVVVGMGYGDEGKGSVVDFLTRETGATAIVRFIGGPQAAHNVVLPDGRHHCFSQIGSGSFVPGVRTYILDTVLVRPETLVEEAKVLIDKGVTDIHSRVVIDPKCRVVTPYHALVGCVRELIRGKGRYGSTGMGVGEAVRDQSGFTVNDVLAGKTFQEKLEVHKGRKLNEAIFLLKDSGISKRSQAYEEADAAIEILASKSVFSTILEDYHTFRNTPFLYMPSVNMLSGILSTTEYFIFEGSQGALLDAKAGFWPYVTKTPCIAGAAGKFLTGKSLTFKGSDIVTVGVLRAYVTRHGPGPLLTESTTLTHSLQEEHNVHHTWQGRMRVGWFDVLTTRLAFDINWGINYTALTCLDRLDTIPKIRVCTSYQYRGDSLNELNRYSEWTKEGSVIKITRLKPVPSNGECGFTIFLSKCKAFEYEEFCGANRVNRFQEFIEGAVFEDMPVGIKSWGPSSGDKEFTALWKYPHLKRPKEECLYA